jgi:hypothetical protein
MQPSMIAKFPGTILVGLVALLLTTIPAPTADQPSPQQRCATRDVQTLILSKTMEKRETSCLNGSQRPG